MGFDFFAWNCEELAWKGYVFLGDIFGYSLKRNKSRPGSAKH